METSFDFGMIGGRNTKKGVSKIVHSVITKKLPHKPNGELARGILDLASHIEEDPVRMGK